MTRVSLPRASGVPYAVGVKNGPMPAPAARMRSAMVPCGTHSSSILPARYASANAAALGFLRSDERANEQIILRTRPASISWLSPRAPLPALLLTIVSSRAPCSSKAQIKAVGTPDAPKPPISTTAPSCTPATASCSDSTVLSNISVLLAMRPRLARGRPAQDGGRLAGQRAAVAVHQHDLGARDLALAGLGAQLPDRLDDEEDAVHAGVHARQSAAIGVDRQAPARRNGAALHERPAFALAAEAEVLQEQQGIDGESVVQLDHVDIVHAQPGHVEGAPPRFRGG